MDTTSADYRPPALILGSSLTALGVLRSLGRAGIPTYSLCGPQELPAKSRWYRPAPRQGKQIPDPEELPEYLRGLPAERMVLIPCSDDWARAVGYLSEDLKSQFPAAVADGRVIDLMTDKWLFAQLLERENIPHPTTLRVGSLEELAALPEASFENMFLKPLDSQTFSARSGTKAYELTGRDHALQIMRAMQADGAGAFPILLQEFIPGPASSYYLVDGFVDSGGCTRAVIARRRHRQYPIPFGNSTLSETIACAQVEEPIHQLSRIWKATGYRGIFDAEFKSDPRDGGYKLVEINPRPWWFVEFASRCGVELCRMAYLDALGLPVANTSEYPVGRRCVYMLYDFNSHRATDPGLAGFARWVRSLRKTEDIVYCGDDPHPAIFLIGSKLKKALTARPARTSSDRMSAPWLLHRRKPRS